MLPENARTQLDGMAVVPHPLQVKAYPQTGQHRHTRHRLARRGRRRSDGEDRLNR